MRNILSKPIHQAVHKSPPPAASQTMTTSMSLEPYQGKWTKSEAAHLLRRTTFGPTIEHINEVVVLGLQDTIQKLLDPSNLPVVGPINPGVVQINNEVVPVNDPTIPIGEPWVKKQEDVWRLGNYPDYRDTEAFVRFQTARRVTLRSWKTASILTEGISIYEKMALFWHNHFGVTGEDSGFEFLHNITIMENALGNFRELVKKITLDPAMMFFLNGNENNQRAPNENYARELFELFTIGKGPLAGPGDYTYYTEDDIYAAARVLTGWVVDLRKLIANEEASIALTQDNLLQFIPALHDSGSKTFSHRFGQQTIQNENEQEYATLIDMIFQEEACAYFICRKLYRWFIHYDLTFEVETQIIDPLAQLLLASDYEIKPVLEVLLQSEHFFDEAYRGTMIKNPYDFTTSLLKPFNLLRLTPEDIYTREEFFLQITNFFTLQQMTYFAPPDVAGWKAYYQEPLFYRTWINATTLNFRMFILQTLANTPSGDGPSLEMLDFILQLDNPEDPNLLISQIAAYLYPLPISDEIKDSLKGVLIPGLPDFEWTVEYGAHLANPNDIGLKESVEQKLRRLIAAMLVRPEFFMG